MKLLEEMVACIDDEVEGVERYAKMAIEARPLNPTLANLFYNIAKTEYGHAMTLHDHLTKMMQEEKDKGMEPMPEMLHLWDDKHREMTEAMGKAQNYMGMYKR